MSFEKLQIFLNTNPEYAGLIIFLLAFGESMVITGSILPSAILFSVCVFIFNSEILSIYLIALFAMFGSHLGDLGGFFVGKTIGPNILKMRFFEKRSKLIGRGQKFLDRFGDYAVIFGRFVPAIRPIAPFLIGLSDLRAIRFYRADIIACLLWGIALILLVLSVGSIFK